MGRLRDERHNRAVLDDLAENVAINSAMRAAAVVADEQWHTRTQIRMESIILAAMVKCDGERVQTRVKVWTEIRRSKDLMQLMLEHEWIEIVDRLIYRVRAGILAKERESKLIRPMERRAAMIAHNLNRSAQEARDAWDREDTAIRNEEANERYEKWAATHIGRLAVGGKPVWEVSAAEARVAAVCGIRQWYAVKILAESVPDDGRPLADHRTPADAEAAWARATQETTDWIDDAGR